MKKLYKLPSLSVAIPALNEQNTLARLILSIIRQKRKRYILEHIFVMCDGSSDKTDSIIINLSKKYPELKHIDTKYRVSKLQKLNYIYSQNTSELLLTLDADVLLGTNQEIDMLIQTLGTDRNARIVAANMVPYTPKGFIPKILYTRHMLWNAIRSNVPNGDHIANLYGQATLLKKNFSKTIKYPEGTTADEEFLYMSAKKVDGFRYSRDTKIYYTAPQTFYEARLLYHRTSLERNSLIEYFGPSIILLHKMPIPYIIKGIFKTFIGSPIYTLLALITDLLLPHFPIEDTNNMHGMWVQLKTTKIAI